MKSLYLLANALGFIPDNRSIGWKEDPYLWMCELQKWLNNKYNIIAFVNPIETILIDKRAYQSRVLTQTSITIGGIYESYPLALKVALENGIKSI